MKKILSLLCFLILLLSFSSLVSADVNPYLQFGYSNFNEENNVIVEEEFLLKTNHSLGFAITSGNKVHDITPYEAVDSEGNTRIVSTDEEIFFVIDLYYRYYFSQESVRGFYLTGLIGYEDSNFNSSFLYGGNLGYKLRLTKHLNLDLRYNLRFIDSETYNDAALLIGYYFSDNI